jgi:mannosylglycoprotein endo-beta-mannosidase
MVRKVWEKPVSGNTPTLRWNNKIRAIRKHLSGWARHVTNILKKEKLRLSSIIDSLEALAEVRSLSPQEIELKSQSNAQIASLLRKEELKWYQRSKAQFILEGDSNTRYFHGVANGRHRKKRIHSLVQDNGRIEGHEQLKAYVTNYYRNLFGAQEESSFSLNETQTDDIPHVSMEKNGFLTEPYSEKEVMKAIFLMEHNKASGPDGFPAEFYQTFWDTIKSDPLDLFNVLPTGQLELFRLNFGEVILLPKVNQAERIQQFRPICLWNVSFKIFTKVVTIRLNTVADHVVRPSQTAFMQGRNILDGVFILHEAVHETPYQKVEWGNFETRFRKGL